MNNEIKTDYGILMAKKTERLVTALYLVTDLIPETEPIKQNLRRDAMALLSAMNSLAQIDVRDRIIELKVSLKFVMEIISMLNVSVVVGIVSEMNGSILIEGFRSLQLVLEKRQPIFNKEMISIDEEDELNTNVSLTNAVTSTSYDAMTRSNTIKHLSESTSQDIHKGHILKTFDIKDDNHLNALEIKNKESFHQTINRVKDNTSLDTSFQLRKYNRKDQILALFVRGVDINIKDISSRIKGCSEKTIQRELNNLVFEGKINRIGEKRWSRYILR